MPTDYSEVVYFIISIVTNKYDMSFIKSNTCSNKKQVKSEIYKL